MGSGITDVEPAQGFAAQTGAATVILASSHLGFALSTTHVCSGAVLGSGVGRKGATVRWGTAGRIALSWLVTLPAAGLVAAGAALLTERGDWGVMLVGTVGLTVCVGAWLFSKRTPVDHHNVNEAPPAPPLHPVMPIAPLAATIPSPVVTAAPRKEAAL